MWLMCLGLDPAPRDEAGSSPDQPNLTIRWTGTAFSTEAVFIAGHPLP